MYLSPGRWNKSGRPAGRYAVALFVLGIFLSAAFLFAASSADIRLVADRDYWHAVRPLINNSESSLHIGQLYLNPDRLGRQILSDLEDVAERGVAIKLLLNYDASRNREAVERLTAAGAEIVHGGRVPPGRLHAKLVVSDRERVLIGSTNWSGVSMYHNREVNLMVSDPEIAGFYADWIEALRENPGEDSELAPVENEKWRTVVDREHGEVVRSLLEGATERVWLGLYAYRTYFGTVYEGSISDQLARELVAKAEAGVDVRVILDKSGYNEFINRINRETATWFHGQGPEVRFNPRNETAHWKLLIVDDQALVGSMNWGHSGFDLHSEASILIKTPDPVEELAAYFQSRWEDSTALEHREDPAAAPAP